jgi:hypothetical protein
MGTKQLGEYRRKLIDAFPLLPFEGLVSTHKRWDELSPEVVFHGSIGLPLLEPSALIAFLPAWLLRSLETSDLDDPIVMEFTLYLLCPGDFVPKDHFVQKDRDDGWHDESIAERVGFFNSGQRDAVAHFLRFVNWAEVQDWERRAEFGLRLWQPK